MAHSILLVGTASLCHPLIADTLRAMGYRTVEIENVDLALGALNAVKADVLILDLELGDDKMVRVAAEARRKQVGLKVVIVGRGDLDGVFDASVDAVIHADFFLQGIHGLVRELCDI